MATELTPRGRLYREGYEAGWADREPVVERPDEGIERALTRTMLREAMDVARNLYSAAYGGRHTATLSASENALIDRLRALNVETGELLAGRTVAARQPADECRQCRGRGSVIDFEVDAGRRGVPINCPSCRGSGKAAAGA